jgi:GTPase SAR1 family protein
MWDVGGCDKIRPLWRHYFNGTDLVLFVFDSTQAGQRKYEAEEILKMVNEIPKAPILFIANKQDLQGAKSMEEISKVFKLNELFKERKYKMMSLSVVNGLGMDKILDEMCTLLDDEVREVKEENIVPEKTILESWLEVEDESDEEFLRKLEDYSLDKWDHRTHLRIAWIYLTKYGRKDGMNKIFSGIKNFILNSPRSRKTTFNETMTYFW